MAYFQSLLLEAPSIENTNQETKKQRESDFCHQQRLGQMTASELVQKPNVCKII